MVRGGNFLPEKEDVRSVRDQENERTHAVKGSENSAEYGSGAT